ncbi:MOSC domain-containing protein [Aliigemmobacter aestuarii]|uniref:MOSC domain-containing protein n=1 Tax=Aliigemmobacter aestuarii TaxID=1445661 RepID=A0A4S3MRR0_9RHOB|nr:MOSC domain-containing protein [Gemmobacter aestuarii]THD85199.1 MOSC domain-containing protein [Gemmobacter aestuarii]
MTARLAQIRRHPIKSHGREALASVRLSAGAGLPWDRHWAVAHDAARLEPGWNPCQMFARGAKAPALMAISAALDEDSAAITLRHPDLPDLTFRPDDAADQAQFIDWVMPLAPKDRPLPARIVSAGRIMSDTDFPSVSVLNLASNRALSERMGVDLSPERWRGNLWVEGLAPWEEFDLIGRTLAIGEARLKIMEPIARCKATTANPATGRIDADTLAALNRHYDHQEFGVYATVEQGGTISIEDEVRVL